jgi:uncharacterized membrane protein YfcA
MAAAPPPPEVPPLSALHAFLADHGTAGLLAAAAVLFAGGVAKGATGFALPLVAVGGLAAFLPAQTAVALMIVPTLATNIWQALRQGLGAAGETLARYRRLNLALLPTILICAQLLAALPDRPIFLILGVGLVGFSALQIAGPRLPVTGPRAHAAEIGAGLVGGFFGGVAGIWGPPIALYLMARDTPKAEAMRAMGLSFLLGSVVLTLGHTASGVLDREGAALSAFALAPVAAGMAAGLALADRMDQALFRRVALAVIVVAGLNLLRRAAFG